MRRSLVVLACSVCVSAQGPAPKRAQCPISVPPSATRANPDSLTRLVGDYELIQVSWQPAPPSVMRGHLHLAVPDSGPREVPCGLRTRRRDVVGWYQREGVGASNRIDAVLDGPGIWVGSFCGVDGGGDVLAITAVSPQGFWGSWRSDLGIAVAIDTVTHTLLPDPAGFFCAVRQADSTASVVGGVRDEEGRPLFEALVQAPEARSLARSDATGRFELRGLAPGRRHLVVRVLGFDPIDTVLTLRRGERRTWNVTMPTPKWVAQAARAESANVAAGAVDSIGLGLVATDTSTAFTYERFGLDLLRAAIETGSPDQNRVVSPLSAGQALALALAAAQDSTASAIAGALHLGALGSEGLATRSQRFNAGVRNRRDVTLRVANALWVDTSATLQPAFDGWARQWYGAPVRRLPLRVPSVVPVINAWADSATRGVIPKIREKPFADSAVVALTNAVYFKGLWLDPFDSAQTRNRDFTTSSGARISTPTMERTGTFAYRRASGYQVLRVPYRAGLTAMYIVLPDSGVGVGTVLEALSRTGWPIPNAAREARLVALRLPRLHVAQALDLRAPFQRLHLGIVFDSTRADFGGLIVPGPSRPPLCPPASGGPSFGPCSRFWIQEATQQVYVDVNEKGTEAAAVTTLGFGIVVTAAIAPIPFFVDRPFLFALRDEKSGTFLFLGWVARPRE